MKKLTMWTAAASLAASMTLLGGCSSSNGPITSESFRHDPSPELYSLTRSKEQYKNDQAEVIDLDTRQIPDDINAIFFLDRPLHLSPYAIP